MEMKGCHGEFFDRLRINFTRHSLSLLPDSCEIASSFRSLAMTPQNQRGRLRE